MVQIWKSKTLWVNLLAAMGLFLSSQWGFQLSPEMVGLILAGINALLRTVTKEPLEW
jgi:hypothetical protein